MNVSWFGLNSTLPIIGDEGKTALNQDKTSSLTSYLNGTCIIDY